jgi:hypothetical protein
LHREPLKPVGPVLLPLFEEDGGEQEVAPTLFLARR